MRSLKEIKESVNLMNENGTLDYYIPRQAFYWLTHTLLIIVVK